MLKLANETLDAIRGDCALESAFEVKDQCWIAHPKKGDHMILFNYSGGILSMSMGECEHDLNEGLQIIAYDDDNFYESNTLTDTTLFIDGSPSFGSKI